MAAVRIQGATFPVLMLARIGVLTWKRGGINVRIKNVYWLSRGAPPLDPAPAEGLPPTPSTRPEGRKSVDTGLGCRGTALAGVALVW